MFVEKGTHMQVSTLSDNELLLVATTLLKANKLHCSLDYLIQRITSHYLEVNMGSKGLLACVGYQPLPTKLQRILGPSTPQQPLISISWLYSSKPSEADKLMPTLLAALPTNARALAFVRQSNYKARDFFNRNGFSSVDSVASPYSNGRLVVYEF